MKYFYTVSVTELVVTDVDTGPGDSQVEDDVIIEGDFTIFLHQFSTKYV